MSMKKYFLIKKFCYCLSIGPITTSENLHMDQGFDCLSSKQVQSGKSWQE